MLPFIDKGKTAHVHHSTKMVILKFKKNLHLSAYQTFHMSYCVCSFFKNHIINKSKMRKINNKAVVKDQCYNEASLSQ